MLPRAGVESEVWMSTAAVSRGTGSRGTGSLGESRPCADMMASERSCIQHGRMCRYRVDVLPVCAFVRLISIYSDIHMIFIICVLQTRMACIQSAPPTCYCAHPICTHSGVHEGVEDDDVRERQAVGV